MGKLPTQINVIVHYPKTEEGRQELARRVALVHADAVNHHIKNLNCPTSDKLKLLDAVIETAKKTYGKAVEKANRGENQATTKQVKYTTAPCSLPWTDTICKRIKRRLGDGKW